MSGNFARGFMSTFGDSYRMERASRENAFERMYNSFEKNKEYITKVKAQDAKDLAMAKAIVDARPELAGNPAALKFAYEQVKAGRKEELILKDLEAINLTDPSPSPGATIDDQTKAVLAAPGEEFKQPALPGTAEAQQQNNPAEQVPVKGAGLPDKVQNMLDRLFKPRERVFIEKIAKEQGIPVEEAIKIAQLNPTLVQEDSLAGQASAIATPKNAVFDNIDDKEVWNQANSLQEGRKEKVANVSDAKVNLKNLTVSGAKRAEIVQRNPGAKTDWTGGATQYLTKLVEEISAAGTLLGDMALPERAKVLTQEANTLSKEIAQIESSGMEQTAKDKLLLDMYTKLDVYTLGALYAQQGRSISNQDFMQFYDNLDSGYGAENYTALVQDMITRLSSEVDSRIMSLNNDPSVTQHNNNVKNSRLKDRPEMIVPPVTTYKEDMEKDPEAKAAYDKLMSYNKVPKLGRDEATSAATPTPGTLPKGITEESIQYTMKKRNLTRQQVLDQLGIK